MNTGTLLWGLLFSSIGIGYALYGKKQRAMVPLFSGLALIFYSYFISNMVLVVIIGVVLTALPYFFRF